MQNKVSIIVACYNKETYIGAMLDSVLAQTWDNIELILVNDGSTDATRDIITSYLPKFETRGYGAKLVDQENQGVAFAIRKGLLESTGHYVCMPDCDDLLYPEYVSTMAGWLDDHPDDLYSVCDFHNVRKTYYHWIGINIAFETFNNPTRISSVGNILERWMLLNAWGAVWNLMISRQHLIECGVLDTLILPNGRFTQEPQIWLPILLSSKHGNGTYIPTALYYYRGGTSGAISPNENSTVKQKINHVTAYCGLIDETLDILGRSTEKTALLTKVRFYSEMFGLVPMYYNDLSELLLSHNIIRYKIPRQTQIGTLRPFLHSLFIPELRDALDSVFFPSGRVIVAAALGKAANRYLTLLSSLGINPTLWDESAQTEDTATKPDYGSLSENDTVLIFTRQEAILQSIKESIKETRVSHIIEKARFDQILDCYNIYNRLALDGNQNRLKVSIVSPCYNKAQYIEEFVWSIINQEYDNIEVVFVNDGSNDGTEYLIYHCENILSGRGFEVKTINQVNQGVAIAARNGLLACTGDLVCLPDCDDRLFPRYVSMLANRLANHPDEEFAVCDLMHGTERFHWYAAGVRPIEKTTRFSEFFLDRIEGFVLGAAFGAVWTMMVRSEYLLKSGALECLAYKSARHTHESQIWLPVLLSGGEASYLPIPLYDWRIVPSSLSDKTTIQKVEEYADSYCDQMRNALTVKNVPQGKYEVLVELRKRMETYDFGMFWFVSKYLSDIGILKKGIHSVSLKQLRLLVWQRFCPHVYKTLEAEFNRLTADLDGYRIIACGALGKSARNILPRLIGTELEPAELWDKNGGGTMVKPPDYDSLRDRDCVIVLPQQSSAVSEIKNALKRTSAKVIYRESLDKMLDNMKAYQLYKEYFI